MRAKRKGRWVFTERNYFADRLDIPPDLSADAVEGTACEHGGFLIGNVLVCGKCGDESEQLGHAVLYLAHRISHKVTGKSFTSDDVVGTVALALVLNQKRILGAENPGGMAYTIGLRAARKLYRNGKSVLAQAEGKLKLPSEVKEGNKLVTTAQRLEHLDQHNVEKGLQREWAENSYSRVKTFPHLDLVMNAANLLLLQRAVEEAKRNLPLHVWRVIDLRLGLEDDEPRTWRQISKVTPFKFNDLPDVYARGLATMKPYIITKLISTGSKVA
jgi:hypothetical protein